jgi:phage gp46-like protein
MIDIACRRGDFAIVFDDIETEDTLETAVMLSLFTDRRDDESAQRGWWGDCVADVKDDRFGSRLWLLDRATKGPATLHLAEDYAKEALAWALEDGAAIGVTVSAKYLDTSANSGIGLSVTLGLPGGLTRAWNFANASGTWL